MSDELKLLPEENQFLSEYLQLCQKYKVMIISEGEELELITKENIEEGDLWSTECIKESTINKRKYRIQGG